MNLIAKVGIGAGAIAGVSGGAYGIYNSMQSKPTTLEDTIEITSYAKKLNGTLLNTNNDENQTEWTARLTSLKNVLANTLVDELSTIKSKNNSATWQELRNWCKDNINKQSKGEQNREFKNIQSYCTFSIKERISNAINETESDDSNKWQKGHEALKGIQDENQLDDALKEAKTKENAEAKTAIKGWCTEAYKKPYKGENDKDYKNASRICVNS